VRIEGDAQLVAPAEADAYFASRPRMSQIGAWASVQSQPLASREAFEQRLARFEAQFEGRDVPRPDGWSGIRVVPQRIEFWYGADFRLHERWCYEADAAGQWSKRMLFP
jgi:pyridoxamine 5'-phosphate oxidase